MEIDPFTLVAQVVNFAILVAILNRFLWKPLLAALDARAARLRKTEEELETRLRRAEEESARSEALASSLAAEREAILETARAEAEAARTEGRRSLLEEADEERLAWRSELADRRKDFLASLRNRAGVCLGDVAARAVRELADESLEARIVGIFSDRLRRIDGERAAEIREAIEGGMARALVRSSFPLDGGARSQISSALSEGLGYAGETEFEASLLPSSGLALEIAGFRISWDLETWARVFEDRLKASLGREA